MMEKEKSGKIKDPRHNLRAEAEAKFAGGQKLSPDLEKMSQEELLHELRAHQIELEMQNEELRGNQGIISNARDKYAALYDFAPSGYMTLKRGGIILNANLTASTFLGVDRHKVIGAMFRKFVEAEYIELWDRYIIDVFKGDTKERCELALKRSDKAVRYVQIDSMRVETSSAKDIAPETVVNISIVDITERMKLEMDREKAIKWQQYVVLLQQMLLGPTSFENKLIAITDGIVKIFNADFCRIWLIGPGDLCDKGCVHAMVKDGPGACLHRNRCLHLVASSGRYTHIDGKDHARVPFGVYKIGRIASGKAHKFLTNDVINDPGVHDHEWARQLGLVSFAGYRLRTQNEEGMGVVALFAKHTISPTEDAAIDSLSANAAFIVQKDALDRAIIQSEKMASLGRLISDISHEVNNPLMIISSHAQLALMSGSPSDKVKETLELIIKECQRAADIMHRTLKFAQPSKNKVEEADICKSIDAVVNMIEKPFETANVEIKRYYPEKPAIIPVDNQLIQEVFMNILNNAKEAMPGGGIIHIAVSTESDFLRIDFNDTGCGMSEEAKKRIFEPFFSTKEKGTGLGLSICYGIIKAHNGEMRFESQHDKGSTVTVLLPLGGG